MTRGSDSRSAETPGRPSSLWPRSRSPLTGWPAGVAGEVRLSRRFSRRSLEAAGRTRHSRDLRPAERRSPGCSHCLAGPPAPGWPVTPQHPRLPHPHRLPKPTRPLCAGRPGNLGRQTKQIRRQQRLQLPTGPSLLGRGPAGSRTPELLPQTLWVRPTWRSPCWQVWVPVVGVGLHPPHPSQPQGTAFTPHCREESPGSRTLVPITRGSAQSWTEHEWAAVRRGGGERTGAGGVTVGG